MGGSWRLGLHPRVVAPAGLDCVPVDALECLLERLVGVAGLEQRDEVRVEDRAPLLLPALGLACARAQEPDQRPALGVAGPALELGTPAAVAAVDAVILRLGPADEVLQRDVVLADQEDVVLAADVLLLLELLRLRVELEAGVVIARALVVPGVRSDVPEEGVDVLVEALVVEDRPRLLAALALLVVVDQELLLGGAEVAAGGRGAAVLPVLLAIAAQAHHAALPELERVDHLRRFRPVR